MVDGDIKLDKNIVRVEGDFLETTCHDLILDHPERHKGEGKYRRALVHGFNDELVINWQNDYPGGTVINGPLKTGIIKQSIIVEGPDLKLDNPDRRKKQGGDRRALVHGFNDELVINWQNDYPGGTVINGVLTTDGVEISKLIVNQIYKISELIGELNIKEVKKAHPNEPLELRPAEINLISANEVENVKISLNHFSSASWPKWPDESELKTLNLIEEIAKMKKEILSLREEVEKLKNK